MESVVIVYECNTYNIKYSENRKNIQDLRQPPDPELISFT